jgi:hypothetical protein
MTGRARVNRVQLTQERAEEIIRALQSGRRERGGSAARGYGEDVRRPMRSSASSMDAMSSECVRVSCGSPRTSGGIPWLCTGGRSGGADDVNGGERG